MEDRDQLSRYRGIGMGMGEIGIGQRPVLVIVDMQKAFIAGKLGSDRTESVITATSTLLQAARANQIPIIFLRVVYQSPDEVGLVWQTKCPSMGDCVPDSEAIEFDPRVSPQPGEELIEKTRASGFFETTLQRALDRLGADTLLITGTSTSGCVRATAVDAAMRDYRTLIVEDCVDDRAPDSHHASLVDFHTKYGEVVSLEGLLETFRA
jgi:maleamate amidohydrolase